MKDNIRAKIVERASHLGLSAGDLAARCRELSDESPDVETVRRFLKGERPMNSRYVSLICDVLKLQLKRVR